jgi:hypothetical protein
LQEERNLQTEKRSKSIGGQYMSIGRQYMIAACRCTANGSVPLHIFNKKKNQKTIINIKKIERGKKS